MCNAAPVSMLSGAAGILHSLFKVVERVRQQTKLQASRRGLVGVSFAAFLALAQWRDLTQDRRWIGRTTSSQGLLSSSVQLVTVVLVPLAAGIRQHSIRTFDPQAG